MKFPNFFRLNDWPKKKFITLLFSLQISVLGLILLDMVGLEFPILRYLVCFFYLTFLPGILILRIFNFHELGDIETTLYSVGLSISFLMFIGFFCNITFPIFGIINPLSTTHLIVIILLAITFLCTVCYVIDKYSNMQPSYRINFDNSLYLFLLLPILSILGALVKNFFGLNLVLITLIILICICFILIGFEIIDKKSTYPIFIFLISLSLLYHTSLISGYLWGTDIHLEFYISNLVKNFGYCNFSTHDNLYSVLSVTILAPIYSSFLNIDIKWLFKAIYPLIFSFVPLGLYRLFEKQSNETIAFFSCIFFISVTPFYTLMLEVPRQQISELFLVLLLLLITTSEMDRIKRLCLTIIFSMSLAVSHYGLSFIYLFAVIYTWIILFFIKMDLMKLLLLIKSNYLIKYFKHKKENKLIQDPKEFFSFTYVMLLIKSNYLMKYFKHKKENKLIQDPTKEFFSFTYVMFMIVFTLGWYKCISDSSVYDTVVYILDSFISGLTTGLLNPNKVEALNAIFKDSSIVYNIIKYLHLLTQFFIVIGFFSSIKSRKKLGKDYFIFTSFFLGICFISLVAPNLSENIGTSRLYSICLIPLSLFCVIGFIRIFEILTRYLTSSNTQPKNIFKFFAIFISIFFMFNSGLISHFAQEHLSSIALDELKTREVYNDSDFFGTQWAAENTKQNNLNIYTGTFEAFMLLDFMSKNDINLYDSKTEYLFPFSYILIGPISVQDNEIVERYFKSTGVDFEYFAYKGSIFYNKIVSKSSKIYDNGAINTFFYSSSFDLL